MPVYLRTEAMCSSMLAKACVYSFNDPITLWIADFTPRNTCDTPPHALPKALAASVVDLPSARCSS